MSQYCETFLPEKFNGSHDSLDSFLIKFRNACHVNNLQENEKGVWILQCLQGQALSYIREIGPLFKL